MTFEEAKALWNKEEIEFYKEMLAFNVGLRIRMSARPEGLDLAMDNIQDELDRAEIASRADQTITLIKQRLSFLQ